jgi:hypothetical protein
MSRGTLRTTIPAPGVAGHPPLHRGDRVRVIG